MRLIIVPTLEMVDRAEQRLAAPSAAPRAGYPDLHELSESQGK